MRKLTLILTTLFVFYGCDDNMSYMEDKMIPDAQLIELIDADPNKFEIDAMDMPEMTKNVVDAEYYDYMVISAEISPEYGYKLSLGDMAIDAGDVAGLYFAKDGRKLGRKDGSDDRKRHKKRCFRFVYPLTFSLGETSYTVNDHSEFKEAMKAYYEETGEKQRPAYAYPIEVQFKGEEGTVAINSDEELKEAFQACRGEHNDKKCFSLGFPVSFTMPDGSILTAEDEEDLEEKMKAFYESYEGKKKRPRVIYPVDLVFEDGSTLTVNSFQEMKQAWRDNCRKRGDDDGDGEGEGESGGTRG